MKTFALACTAALGLALAAPAFAQNTSRPDTGNMAYPTPVPQGNIGTTTTGQGTPDTGNMAYPTPVPQGNIGTTGITSQNRPDTGNMAYPAPMPQGNIGTTTVK